MGPFFDESGLLKCWGHDRRFLEERIAIGEVLHVVTSDGMTLFPSFQFDSEGGLLPRLAEMLELVDPDMRNPWGDALWLNAPQEDLDGMTPAEALRTSRADDALTIGSHAGAFRLP
ncbi:hypothetical protein [Frondihabitans australicus]|uniref:Antitoxin Xre/MbcA/ParS-like toxin-binding domain-containing protein n=1 Tax=Frondihabitans australicus TaxID=386892 RepID=A0A495IFE3_9MICO|nr:hypothetical protein [Frondihabitans australicus]RKR74733.1 hypothetical protein C8E83_1862 [Frondihabitans australicus]